MLHAHHFKATLRRRECTASGSRQAGCLAVRCDGSSTPLHLHAFGGSPAFEPAAAGEPAAAAAAAAATATASSAASAAYVRVTPAVQYLQPTRKPATSLLYSRLHQYLVGDLGFPPAVLEQAFGLVSAGLLVADFKRIQARVVRWLQLGNGGVPRLNARALLTLCPKYLALDPDELLPSILALAELLPGYNLTDILASSPDAVAAGEASAIARHHKAACKRLPAFRRRLPTSFPVPVTSSPPAPPPPGSLQQLPAVHANALCSQLGVTLARKLLRDHPSVAGEDAADVVRRFRSLQAHLGMDAATLAAVCTEAPCLLVACAAVQAGRVRALQALLRTFNSEQVAGLVVACPWALAQPVGAVEQLLGEAGMLASLRPSWEAQWRRRTPKLLAAFLRDSSPALCLLEYGAELGFLRVSLRSVIQRRSAAYAELLYHYSRSRWPSSGVGQVVDMASASAEAARQLPEDWEDDLEQVLDICSSRDPSLTSIPLDALRRRFALIFAELPTALQRNVVELSARCPWLLRLQPTYVRRVFVQLQDLCALREDWEVQSLALRPGALALFLRSNELVLLRLEYLAYLNDGTITLQQAITETEAAWQEAFPLFQYWLVHGTHPPRHRQQQRLG